MSDYQEPSYYEIALTNRQVLVAFVILLVGLVVAFFAGVWVGRGATPAQIATVQTVSDVGPEVDEPEEFEFFNDGGADSEPASDPSSGPVDDGGATTLAEDLGAEPAKGATGDDAGRKRRDRKPRQAASGGGERATPEPVPTPAREAPAEASGPAVTETATAAEPAAAAEGELIIQVLSTRDEVQARRLMTRLSAAGLTAFLSPAEGPSGVMYRVRLGPYTERSEAEAVAERVRRDFRVDTWITAP